MTDIGKPHKIMTQEEYERADYKNPHIVERNCDGVGNVAYWPLDPVLAVEFDRGKLLRMEFDRKCCYLEGGKRDGAPCHAHAEWEIFGTNLPYCPVDACTKHVGALLDDSKESRVYPVATP